LIYIPGTVDSDTFAQSLVHLGAMKALTDLTLQVNLNNLHSGVAQLSGISKLTGLTQLWVSLAGCNLTDADIKEVLEIIAPLKSLTKLQLMLNCNQLSTSGLDALRCIGGLPLLKELQLGFWDSAFCGSVAQFSFLGKMTSLTSLDLGFYGCSLTAQNLKEVLVPIGSLTSLTALTLDLRKNDLRDDLAPLSCIASLRNLTYLILFVEKLTKDLEFIGSLTSLTTLNLYTDGEMFNNVADVKNSFASKST